MYKEQNAKERDDRLTTFSHRVRVVDFKGKTESKPIKTEPEQEGEIVLVNQKRTKSTNALVFIVAFDITAQPQSDKFVVESKKSDSGSINGGQTSVDWPFKMICEHLCMDLFDPTWEIRHGAGIGLRSILKGHGAGAGKTGNVYDREEGPLLKLPSSHSWIQCL